MRPPCWQRIIATLTLAPKARARLPRGLVEHAAAAMWRGGQDLAELAGVTIRRAAVVRAGHEKIWKYAEPFKPIELNTGLGFRPRKVKMNEHVPMMAAVAGGKESSLAGNDMSREAIRIHRLNLATFDRPGATPSSMPNTLDVACDGFSRC